MKDRQDLRVSAIFFGFGNRKTLAVGPFLTRSISSTLIAGAPYKMARVVATSLPSGVRLLLLDVPLASLASRRFAYPPIAPSRSAVRYLSAPPSVSSSTSSSAGTRQAGSSIAPSAIASSASSDSKYPDFGTPITARHSPSSSSFRRGSRLRRTLFYLGWIPVAAFIATHVCTLANITGNSMSPTFNPSSTTSSSDIVLLNRTITYQHEALRAGDIVTLISPLNPNTLLVKRVIALPGDTVRVWAPGSSAKHVGRWTRIKIPPGHVWVEGDAAVDIVPGSLEGEAYGKTAAGRGKSRDSREFGPVPMGLVTGRIEYVVWPPARFGHPAPRPSSNSIGSGPQQYPPSSTDRRRREDRSTQVNPSIARILEEMTKLDPKSRSKAHPEDSVISPYVDWNDPNAREPQDGDAKEQDRGKEDRIRKHAWNHLSRGGRLGDDAD